MRRKIQDRRRITIILHDSDVTFLAAHYPSLSVAQIIRFIARHHVNQLRENSNVGATKSGLDIQSILEKSSIVDGG
jgi:hypothetical protein